MVYSISKEKINWFIPFARNKPMKKALLAVIKMAPTT